MDKADFLVAKEYMTKDIEREIQLARTKKRSLKTLGINPGGGNFLAALGLLCYTEFGGWLLRGKPTPQRNFDAFFDRLGKPYADLRQKHKKVYNTFRCGLAHEYFVKRSCTIHMKGKRGQPGIWQERDGHYRFSVSRYWRDLKAAFDVLQEELYGS